MPEQLPDKLLSEVERLLRQGMAANEVARHLGGAAERLGVKITPARVRMEAYRLGIELPRGRRKGVRMPGVGGRTHGTPNRERAFELFRKGLRPAQVAGELQISRTRAGKFHEEYLIILDAEKQN